MTLNFVRVPNGVIPTWLSSHKRVIICETARKLCNSNESVQTNWMLRYYLNQLPVHFCRTCHVVCEQVIRFLIRYLYNDGFRRGAGELGGSAARADISSFYLWQHVKSLRLWISLPYVSWPVLSALNNRLKHVSYCTDQKRISSHDNGCYRYGEVKDHCFVESEAV